MTSPALMTRLLPPILHHHLAQLRAGQVTGEVVRGQSWHPRHLLLPEAVDDYVGAENPVLFIDAFVDGLDLAAAGFAGVTPNRRGVQPPVSRTWAGYWQRAQ